MPAILHNLRCRADVPRLRTRWSGVPSGRTKINELAAMFLRHVLLNGRCAIQMAFVAHFCSVEWLMKRPFDYRCQGSGESHGARGAKPGLQFDSDDLPRSGRRAG